MAGGASVDHGDAVVGASVVVDMIVPTEAGRGAECLEERERTSIFTIGADVFLLEALGVACFPGVDVLVNRNMKEAEGLAWPALYGTDFFQPGFLRGLNALSRGVEAKELVKRLVGFVF